MVGNAFINNFAALQYSLQTKCLPSKKISLGSGQKKEKQNRKQMSLVIIFSCLSVQYTNQMFAKSQQYITATSILNSYSIFFTQEKYFFILSFSYSEPTLYAAHCFIRKIFSRQSCIFNRSGRTAGWDVVNVWFGKTEGTAATVLMLTFAHSISFYLFYGIRNMYIVHGD